MISKEPEKSTKLGNKLTPDWPERLVSPPTNVCAVIVLHMRSGWRTAKSKARGVVHLWRGCLAAAAVAAVATDTILRC